MLGSNGQYVLDSLAKKFPDEADVTYCFYGANWELFS